MASLTRVANSNASTTTGGNAGAFGEHHSGGNINFYKIAATGIETSYTGADSNWEKALKAMSGYGTLVVVGTPASGNTIVGLEGSATDSTTLAAMKVDVDAASTLTATITNVSVSGGTFA